MCLHHSATDRSHVFLIYIVCVAAVVIPKCPQGTHDGLLEIRSFFFFTRNSVALEEKTCPKHVTLRGGCAVIRDVQKNRDLFLSPIITVSDTLTRSAVLYVSTVNSVICSPMFIIIKELLEHTLQSEQSFKDF
jgi:hypothetical protein